MCKGAQGLTRQPYNSEFCLMRCALSTDPRAAGGI